MERKIVDYTILKRDYCELFKEKCFDYNLMDVVKDYISRGWTPLGAPFAVEWNILQAMVKYED